MGIITYTDEYTSPVSPERLFNALILDAHNLVPLLMPHAVQSIDTLQGDGRAGSIKLINFVEGDRIKSVKNRVDEVDEKKLVYGYTLVEGDPLIMEKLDYISYKVHFEAAPEGSKNKLVSYYHTKGENVVLKEEQIKAGKEKALRMYKAVEAYLLQYPQDYV